MNHDALWAVIVGQALAWLIAYGSGVLTLGKFLQAHKELAKDVGGLMSRVDSIDKNGTRASHESLAVGTVRISELVGRIVKLEQNAKEITRMSMILQRIDGKIN